jgi:hypothetical protein
MEYTRTATREFPVGEQLTLTIDSRSGNILVDGRDVDTVTIEIVARLYEETAEAADAAMDRLLAGIQGNGDRLVIHAPDLTRSHGWLGFGRGPRVDYEIVVPRQTMCRINGRNGQVEVGSIAGPLDIDQRAGRVTVRGIERDARIDSRSGAVEVMDVGGSVTVAARSGRAYVRAAGVDVTVNCHSGAVEVERVGGRLDARSHSGRVTATDVGGDATLFSQSGPILLENGRGRTKLRTTSGQIGFRGAVLGDLEAQSTSGAIRLEVDPDHPFFVEAESVSGSVRSEIPPRREGPPAASAPRVRLRTVSGSIKLTRLFGSEA